MASTTFEIALGTRTLFPTIREDRTSSFAISVGVLLQADPYGSSAFSRTTTSAKTWLPPPREPVLMPDGTMNGTWYRFLSYLANQRLGGINGPSMDEVQTNVVETKAAAINAAQTVAAIEELAVANAEVLAAAVQVTQNNALEGAEQIPAVILRAPNKTYTESYY